ncbi:hypothetical protein LINPERPRIM_LOCUS819 [Linum perenne]
MDYVLGDLVRAETRLNTQVKLDDTSTETGSVFSAYRPYHQYSPRPQFGHTSPGDIKCRHCGIVGHVQSLCRKRNFCNYCKRPGHIITDCHAKQRNSAAAFGSSYNSAGGSGYNNTNNLFGTSNNATGASSDIKGLVHDALKEVLPTALNATFSSFGVSGNSTSVWHLDSACFNHMTSKSGGFSQLSAYNE